MDYLLIETRAYEQIVQRVTALSDLVAALAERQSRSLAGGWLDTQEVCLTLGISKRTLQHYRNSGQIPYSQIGNKIYHPVDAIRKMLRKNIVRPENR